MSRFPVILLTACLTIGVAPASAADRYAVPDGGATSGACASDTPCRIDRAINQAASGDVVHLAAGQYTTVTPLAAAVPVTIVGVPGATTVGGTFVADPTLALDAGGTVRDVGVGASASGQPALRVRGGLVEHVAAVSQTGDALAATGENGGLLVRDSVLWTQQSAAADALDLTAGGTARLVNVTAWAHEGTAIHCDQTGGTTTLTNVLARGKAADITARGGTCTAGFSSFRPDQATGIGSRVTNQFATPLLRSVDTGDFRPLAGSPTIDAGTSDPDLGTTDPDAQPRVQGPKPDIGAYETFNPTPAPESPRRVVDVPAVAQLPAPAGTTTPPAEAPAKPRLGKSVVLGAADGAVRVKTPGGKFVALADAKNLPVGTVIDTRTGAVTLQTALAGGKAQTGTFSGGMFTVRQDPKAGGMTDIVLTGGSTKGCPKSRPTRTTARAAGNQKPIRRLWGTDKGGRFRTHGSKSVATVRGTRWLTEDRCDGTFTKVTSGAVDVRSKRTGKVTRVRAGHDVLVK